MRQGREAIGIFQVCVGRPVLYFTGNGAFLLVLVEDLPLADTMQTEWAGMPEGGNVLEQLS